MTKIPGLLRPLAKPLAPIGEMAKFKLKPTLQIPNAAGVRYPFRFDGYYDLRPIRGQPAAYTAMKEIPGILTQHSSTLGDALASRGFKMPTHLPSPEVYDALQAPFQPAAVTNPMQQVRTEYLRQAMGL